MYLSQSQNVFVLCAKCICPEQLESASGVRSSTGINSSFPGPHMYLSKLRNVFVLCTKCICLENSCTAASGMRSSTGINPSFPGPHNSSWATSRKSGNNTPLKYNSEYNSRCDNLVRLDLEKKKSKAPINKLKAPEIINVGQGGRLNRRQPVKCKNVKRGEFGNKDPFHSAEECLKQLGWLEHLSKKAERGQRQKEVNRPT